MRNVSMLPFIIYGAKGNQSLWRHVNSSLTDCIAEFKILRRNLYVFLFVVSTRYPFELTKTQCPWYPYDPIKTYCPYPYPIYIYPPLHWLQYPILCPSLYIRHWSISILLTVDQIRVTRSPAPNDSYAVRMLVYMST